MQKILNPSVARKTNNISLIFQNLKLLYSNGKATCYEMCLIKREKAKFPVRKTSHPLALSKETSQNHQARIQL